MKQGAVLQNRRLVYALTVDVRVGVLAGRCRRHDALHVCEYAVLRYNVWAVQLQDVTDGWNKKTLSVVQHHRFDAVGFPACLFDHLPCIAEAFLVE